MPLLRHQKDYITWPPLRVTKYLFTSRSIILQNVVAIMHDMRSRFSPTAKTKVKLAQSHLMICLWNDLHNNSIWSRSDLIRLLATTLSFHKHVPSNQEVPQRPWWFLVSHNVHSPCTAWCPSGQYFCCTSLASWFSLMTGLLRASARVPQVGQSLVVTHARSTSLNWSPGSLNWTLRQSRVPMSTRSWIPRWHHLARHGKVSFMSVRRSAMPKGAAVLVDVKR